MECGRSNEFFGGVGYQKTVFFSWVHSRACLLKAGYHIVSCLIESPMWQGMEGDLQPKASEKLMARQLSSNEETNPINSRVSEFKSRSFSIQAFICDCSPGKHFDRSLVRDLLRERHPAELCLDS